MKIIDCREKPIEVHGLPFFDQTGSFSRLPEDVCKAAPFAGSMAKYSVGARICFRTNSPTVWLRMKVKPLSFTGGMSMIAGQSLHVLFGDRVNPFYAGAWTPRDLQTTEVAATCPFHKKPGQDEVTIIVQEDFLVDRWDKQVIHCQAVVIYFHRRHYLSPLFLQRQLLARRPKSQLRLGQV
jgi:hypothetical protein